MDEFQILNFTDALNLWRLRRSGVDEIIAKSRAETTAIIDVARAESAAFLEGFNARLDAEKRLKGPPELGEPEKLRIRQELEDKQKILATRVESVRQSAASTLQGAKREIELAKRATFKAQLMNPNDSTTANTYATRPETRYYVIIGRGTAAVLNHTTLRQTNAGKDRLKDPKNTSNQLPIMHIGLTDPWYLYQAHGMGQPRHLLVLPGYHYRPSFLDRTIRSGMHSWDFAFKTLQEWALLKMKYAFDHLEGWVALIQNYSEAETDWTPPDLWNEDMEGLNDVKSKLKLEWKKKFAADSAYRLLVVKPDGSVIGVYAEKVDICTGLARAAVRPDKPHREITGVMKQGRPRLWEPPEQWSEEIKNRQVITGPEAMFMITPWNSAHRIYVNGAGGIGLNMVERAEDEGCALDWLHYQLLHQNSFGLARNDTVLKNGTARRPCKPGESGLRNPADASVWSEVVLTTTHKHLMNLYPAYPQWRFGRRATPDYDTIALSNTKLKISIKANTDCKMHDYFEKEVALGDAVLYPGTLPGALPFSPEYKNSNGALVEAEAKQGIYDRFFCCTGQTAGSLGSPQCMAEEPRFTFSPKLDKNNVAVALEADSGAVRILGGALTNHIKYPTLVQATVSDTKTFFLTLPVSAVPPGFIFNGLNIATANGWFDEKPNTNANTATRDEIKNHLVGKGVESALAEALARAVINKRRVANGFESSFELMDALETDPDLVKITGWRLGAYSLELTYREAGKFLD